MPQAADAPLLAFGRSANNRTTGSWKNDYLDREKYAVQLERLIANTPGPYVIGMTSSWGSGKTFFLTAWRESLLERRRPCVYFNAWETDHAGDPLVALAAQVSKQVKEQLGTDDAIFDLVLKKASQIARKAPKALIGGIIGIINQKTGSEIPKDLAQIFSDSFEVGTAAFLEAEKSREHFKYLINRLAKKASENRQLSNPDRVNNSKRFPLLVIIDELDRCRPDYAITLLESIKHLFNETGIVFLISMDADQIFSVIEHTFGLHEKTSGTSSNMRQNYLRKFIDIFWALPDPDPRPFVLQNLLTKRPTIPQDWPIAPSITSYPLVDVQADDPLFSSDSYYFALASAAFGKQKSLRELLQILEKFFVITHCYQMSTTESFVIFDMLMSCTNETKNYDLFNQIGRERFQYLSQTKMGPQMTISLDKRIEANDDPFLAIYTLILENAYKQNHPQIKHRGQTPWGVPLVSDKESLVIYYLEKIFTAFSVEELAKSATQKFSFLEEFHFGEQKDAQDIQGKSDD